MWWLSIPNTLSETKISNLHPKARRRASPSLLYGSPPPLPPQGVKTPESDLYTIAYLLCLQRRPAIPFKFLFSYLWWLSSISLETTINVPSHDPSLESSLIVSVKSKNKARFRLRTFHEPNLMYCMKCMKRSAPESKRNVYFNLERVNRSSLLARPGISALERLWFRRRTFQVPNLMHKLL